jgi:hypothetical protein
MDLNTKLYIITTAKEIPCLGGITGPITTPVKLELSELIWLLNNGFTVYQCNPFDSNERVLVDRMNMNDIKFTRNRAIVTMEQMENLKVQEMSKPIEVIKKDNKPAVTPEPAPEVKDEKKKDSNKVLEADTFQKK